MRLLLAFVLLSGACSSSAPADAPAGPADGPSAPPAPSPTTVSADSTAFEDEARRLIVRVVFPVLSGDAPALDAVNEQLALTADQMWSEMAPDEPLGPDAFEFERYDFDGGFDVTYVGEDFVSVLQSLYAYTGGAHGNQFFAPQTYNLTTGRLLSLGDVLQDTPAAREALRAATEAALLVEAADRFEVTPDEARETLWMEDITAEPEMFEFRWTLGTDSLHLHLPPYAVASYAAGPFHVAIPYADLAGYLGPVTARLAAREDDASAD